MFKVVTIMLFILTMTGIAAFANPTACPQFFLNGKAPDFINQKLAQKTRELCNEGYAVKHSGITRTPLYAAEIITRTGLQNGKGIPRSDNFRPDNRLPAHERSELSDYARSGFDRGHVFPAADASTPNSKDESFLLSNMIPQDSNCNRGIWNDIEDTVRKEAKKRGTLYVVTGPIFQTEAGKLPTLKRRVVIPTFIFKAVVDPARGEGAAYLVNNAPGDEYLVTSIAELEKMAGLNLFPTLPAHAKSRPMPLPKPNGKRRSS